VGGGKVKGGIIIMSEVMGMVVMSGSSVMIGSSVALQSPIISSQQQLLQMQIQQQPLAQMQIMEQTLALGTQKDRMDQDQKNGQGKRVVKKCEHGRQKSQCKDCKGSGICEHNRQKRVCKDCGGSGAEPCLLCQNVLSYAVLVMPCSDFLMLGSSATACFLRPRTPDRKHAVHAARNSLSKF
jgi:hypothetical protein